MTHTTEINDLAELDSYTLTWRALHARTRGASYFQSLDGLRIHLRQLEPDAKLKVLVVEAAGEVVGILPLVVRRLPTDTGIQRGLTYAADEALGLGPLGSQPALTLAVGLKHLASAARDWDSIRLTSIDPSGVEVPDGSRSRTATALAVAGLRAEIEPLAPRALVDLTAGWPEYWRGRDRHFRTNMDRTTRALARLGAIRYERYRPAGRAAGEDDPRWDLFDRCERIAAQRWPTAANLDSEAHAAAVAAGGLDLNVLYLDEQPAAFAYGYHYRGMLHVVRSGYDPQVTRRGAGQVLFARLLADSAARGDRLVDLGNAHEPWKRHWLTHRAAVHGYTHRATPDLRRRAANLMQAGYQFALT